MQLDLNDIRTFVIVAQAGTFSAAAKQLGLPTSTVSRSITRLEQSVGLMLYQRSPRGLTLTDVGNEYLKTCRRTLRSIREGREMLEQYRENPSGLIRIACPETMARDVLAPVLLHFVQDYPELRVEIEPYASGWGREPLEDTDIYFKMKAPRDTSRNAHCFPGTVRALYAATSYLEKHGTPNHPMQLVRHRCIGSGLWKLTKGRKVVTPEILFHIVGNEPGVHLQLVCKAVGIAIIPLWMAKQSKAQKVLVPILESWKPEPITICALYSGPTKVTPKVRVFLDFVGEYLGTELDPRLNGHSPRELFTDLADPAISRSES